MSRLHKDSTSASLSTMTPLNSTYANPPTFMLTETGLALTLTQLDNNKHHIIIIIIVELRHV